MRSRTELAAPNRSISKDSLKSPPGSNGLSGMSSGTTKTLGDGVRALDTGFWVGQHGGGSYHQAP
jgi:hypothetical protein